MADQIAPALTPEEWNPACHWSATAFIVGRYSPDRGMGPRENVGGFEIRVNAEGARAKAGPRAIAEFSDHDAHAIAALALYGQPFGFTRETVIAMTSAAYFLENSEGSLATKWPADANPWHALAADLRREAEKIAALLPPEALNE